MKPGGKTCRDEGLVRKSAFMSRSSPSQSKVQQQYKTLAGERDVHEQTTQHLQIDR